MTVMKSLFFRLLQGAKDVKSTYNSRLTCLKKILITAENLDLIQLNEMVQKEEGTNGASVIFTGSVRKSEESRVLKGMTLEHYPGMTESLLSDILDEASNRWNVSKVIVAHRIGYLSVGEPIVFVGTSSPHRQQAFDSAMFIMDFLKNKATFWKKEHFVVDGLDETFWVKTKRSDEQALDNWATTRDNSD